MLGTHVHCPLVALSRTAQTPKLHRSLSAWCICHGQNHGIKQRSSTVVVGGDRARLAPSGNFERLVDRRAAEYLDSHGAAIAQLDVCKSNRFSARTRVHFFQTRRWIARIMDQTRNLRGARPNRENPLQSGELFTWGDQANGPRIRNSRERVDRMDSQLTVGFAV